MLAISYENLVFCAQGTSTENLEDSKEMNNKERLVFFYGENHFQVNCMLYGDERSVEDER